MTAAQPSYECVQRPILLDGAQPNLIEVCGERFADVILEQARRDEGLHERLPFKVATNRALAANGKPNTGLF